MSAGSFGTDGERRRVAHRVNANAKELMRDLDFKRRSLSLMVQKLSTKRPEKTTKKENPLINGVKGKKPAVKRRTAWSKKYTSSDEEDDLDDDDDYDEEEEEESFDEIEEKNVRRRSVSVSGGEEESGPSASGSNDVSLAAKERSHALSDSESEALEEKEKAEPRWLCKPRLNGNTGGAVKLLGAVEVVRRKRAVISSSSSDEEPEEEKSYQKPAITLKSAVKRAKRLKREAALESDLSDGVETDGSAHVHDSDSSGSGGGVRKGRKKAATGASALELKEMCLQFFNSASKEKLVDAPRSSNRAADFVIRKRPFKNFDDLESKLSDLPRCGRLTEHYMDYLENREVLQKILDDCHHHSEQLQTAVEDLGEKQLHAQPKLLHERCVLHPYQQVGLNWLIMMHKLKMNAILGDEMGLGKTIQVIAFLAHLKESSVRGPHLVVVPSSTIENWMAELSKWCPSIVVLTYYGSMDVRKQLRAMATDKNVDVLLTTYNMIGAKVDDRKFFKRFKINYAIYDEGHLLKNCATDRYKNLMKVRAERKILLTGTPLQNNLVELISLMYFTMTSLFTKYCDEIGQLMHQFQQKIPSMNAASGSLYETDKIDQAKAILQPYILRRLKVNVLSSLPKKNERVVKCAMTSDQRELYTNLVREFRERESQGETMNTGRLMQLRQIANHPLLYRKHYVDERVVLIAKALCAKESEYSKKKWEHVAEDLAFMSDFAISQLCSKFPSAHKFCLDEALALESGKCEELDRLLPTIKNQNDKVLIFSQFTTMLDILEIYLRLRSHSYCRLDGSTPVMERQEMINRFNSTDDLFVFLLSTKAGGMGINLAAANHIIIHDIDFNPYNDKQAADRCHRMGQQKEVFVVRLISKGSVEEGMQSMAQKKLELEKEITGGNVEGNDAEAESQIVEQLLKKALSLD